VQHQRVDELLHLLGGGLHGLRAFAEGLGHYAISGEFFAVALDQHLGVERLAVDFAQAFFQRALKGVGGVGHGDEVAAQGVERLVVHDGSVGQLLRCTRASAAPSRMSTTSPLPEMVAPW